LPKTSPWLDLDALLIARIQFGLTICLHIVFPALTIGLASSLAVLEARWLMMASAVRRPVSLLGQGVRRSLRHGHRDGVSVRHQPE
jgi:hypothetical protein